MKGNILHVSDVCMCVYAPVCTVTLSLSVNVCLVTTTCILYIIRLSYDTFTMHESQGKTAMLINIPLVQTLTPAFVSIMQTKINIY